MYKIVSFRYESVIQKNFARLRREYIFFAPPPPQSQIRSYGLAVARSLVSRNLSMVDKTMEETLMRFGKSKSGAGGLGLVT